MQLLPHNPQHHPKQQQNAIQRVYFVLIPSRPFMSFGGLLCLPCEKLAEEMSKEINGAFVPVSFGIN